MTKSKSSYLWCLAILHRLRSWLVSGKRPCENWRQNRSPLFPLTTFEPYFRLPKVFRFAFFLFSNFGLVICGLHRSLLKELRARISTFSDKTFIGTDLLLESAADIFAGDIFMEHAPILKLYTEFVNNFDNAIDTLEKCLKVDTLDRICSRVIIFFLEQKIC